MPGSVSERRIASKVHLGQDDYRLLSYNDTVFFNHRFPVLGHMRGTQAISRPRRYESTLTKLPPLVRETSFQYIENGTKGPLLYTQTTASSPRSRLDELIRSRRPRIRPENEQRIVAHLRRHLNQRRETAHLQKRSCGHTHNDIKNQNRPPTYSEDLVEARQSMEREGNVNSLLQV
ncbi:hypothetical protein CHS0354_002830 [Potamilus streckersoni]|uniref:Uncharacterized protein n=1 Tax=Potamilus streckersoni TaxID=2493646 RepID=A0AAE0RMQ3_9BIVA|nr:hypothetical protein CHS0354_002830 [Potamilus streckersoni]